MDACPCTSGLPYAACCGPWHAGAEAPTALALMRSRYAAFVRRDAAYLIRTAHPVERARLDARSFRASFALAWEGLEIVACERGWPDDRDGVVHFRARYRGPDGVARVHDERSRFARAGGAWVYRDGRG
jgi:SEC-C motif-containing protein